MASNLVKWQPTHAMLTRSFVASKISSLENWSSECVAYYGIFNIGITLIEVLDRSRRLECSDPRDKYMVFSALPNRLFNGMT